MRALCGEANLRRGAIRSPDGRLEIDSPEAALRYGIWRIHRENVFADSLTIAENLFVLRRNGLRSFWLDGRLIREQTRAILRMVSLDISVDARVETLGAPERQMIELGRALAGGARVILFDEALGEYGTADLDRLREVIDRHEGSGVGFVVNSGRIEELRRLCDRICFFREDRLSKMIEPERLRDEDVPLYLENGFVEDASRYVREPDATSCVLEIDPSRLTMDPPFRVHAGEVVGLACRDAEMRGRILRELSGRAAAQQVRRGIRRGRGVSGRIIVIRDLWNDESLFGHLSIAENVLLPSMRKASGPWGTLPGGLGDFIGIQKEFRELVEQRDVSSLDPIRRVRLILERWRMYRPDVLVVCEPYRFGDAVSTPMIARLLREIADAGCGVVLLSTRRATLVDRCDRICAAGGTE